MESAAPGLWEVLAVIIVGILIIFIIVTAQGSGPRCSPKPLLYGLPGLSRQVSEGKTSLAGHWSGWEVESSQPGEEAGINHLLPQVCLKCQL